MTCKLSGIVGPILMTENPVHVCQREQKFEFSLRLGVVVRAHSVLSLMSYISVMYFTCINLSVITILLNFNVFLR